MCGLCSMNLTLLPCPFANTTDTQSVENRVLVREPWVPSWHAGWALSCCSQVAIALPPQLLRLNHYVSSLLVWSTRRYEKKLMGYLDELIREMDRKIAKARERAEKESAPRPIKADDQLRLDELNQRAKGEKTGGREGGTVLGLFES